MVQPIYKDVYYTTSLEDLTDLKFRITLNNVIIYEGRAYAKPDSDVISINVSQICKYYLENEIPSAAFDVDGEYSINNALRTFVLQTYDVITDRWVDAQTYDFLWYYDYDSDEIPDTLSEPINYHSALGVKNLFTTIEDNLVKVNVETATETNCPETPTPPTPVEKYITVTPQYITAPNTGGSFTVRVLSNTSWVLPAQPYYETDITGGTGNATVTLTFDKNTSSSTQQILNNVIFAQTTDNTFNALINITKEGRYNAIGTLRFKMLQDGVITFKTGTKSEDFSNGENKIIQYMFNDDGVWNSITSTTEGATISVNSGDTVYFKGDNTSYDGVRLFSTAKHNVEGNILSLYRSTNFVGLSRITGTYNFAQLFSNDYGLINATELALPSDSLTEGCYAGMFANCTSLITVPVLPARTLANKCYDSMFAYCVNLTTVSKRLLPSFRSSEECYAGMFAGCHSLRNAPDLFATALTRSCYEMMFEDCPKLTSAPIISATRMGAFSCYYMFHGCTRLTTAPELPVTTLAEGCYKSMFWNCTSLTTAPSLPATTLATECYRGMFQNCLSLTTAPSLPATTLAHGCYNNMFAYCSSLINAPSLPATTLTTECYRGMFYNCTSLTTAPELPAPTLAEKCYASMFDGCTKLNYVKCLATDRTATECDSLWLYNVSPTGTFVKAASMNDWPTGSAVGIPSGWTVEDAVATRLMAVNTNNTKAVNTNNTNNDFVVCYCGQYALYYRNARGGWDTFLFEGNCKRTDNYDILKYTKSYNNTTREFGSNRYLNNITETYELSSGWLDEEESRLFAKHLLPTNRAYLHILDEDRIIPVVITTTSAEFKKYDRINPQPLNYTITVESSQNRELR